MNKQLLLALGAAALVATQADAQRLKDGYVKFPKSTMLHNYVSQWNTSGRAITVDGSAWEDEEFFTSRVKPHARVTETAVNIYNFGDYAGRRSLWWVPIGSPEFQALPNANFDEEPFSMWSYLDHYGCWTAPFGWCTGAMADAAHKNGVAVSGVSSTPNSALSGDWLTSLRSLGSNYSSNADNIGKFLYYHGVDGLGYNSEFSSNSSIVTNLVSMHSKLMTYMSGKNDVFENIWYDGTNESGGISFDSFLSGKNNIFKSASIFSNYNWTNSSQMSSAAATANGLRGYWWQYAGMNQQGGEPKSGESYPLLKNQKWSMGWWGAHSRNMFWEGRGAHGTSNEAIQQGYIKDIEQFFGNGARNPAVHQTITTVRNHRPSDSFHGVSAFINERSALLMALGSEPFYTFFNQGNGAYFNYRGERVSDNEWYSLGFQDYMPTWRYWFAPTWLDKELTTAEQAQLGLHAGITFEDAYMGGSCLKIEGTSSEEYLHLFKTKLTGHASKKLTVRYKLLDGEADVKLVIGNVTAPGTLYAGKKIEGTDQEGNSVTFDTFSNILKAEDCENVKDISFKKGSDGWITKTYTFGSTEGNIRSGGIANIGVIGLKFTNARNMKLLLGEMSIMDATNTAAPAAPVINTSKVLANVYSGVDAKLIWTMDNNAAKTAGTPKYNSDVNVSYFRMWSQEEGGEAVFQGVTTSWAGIIFRAPSTDASKKIRFGVSAVSQNTLAESAITWTDYMSKGSYTQVDDITTDKRTIKVDEDFVISYIDPRHSNSSWALYNSAGTRVAYAASATKLNVPEGLSSTGGYDLVINEGTASEKRYGYYIQVSGDEVGALPQIYTMSLNSSQVSEDAQVPVKIKLTDTPTLSYTGRKADGSASRALMLNSHYIGTSVASTGLASSAQQSFSVAGWFKFAKIPDLKWNFMNVSDKTAGWPQNTWGWAWNAGRPDGSIECVFRGNASDNSSPGELHYEFPDTKLEAETWTHIAWTIDYKNGGFRCQLWINGVLQKSKVYQYATGNKPEQGARTVTINGRSTTLNWTNTTLADGSKRDYGNTDGTDIYIPSQTYAITGSDYIYFGGAAHEGASIDGIVDDFQIWNKAMTEAEVKESMNGYTSSNLNSNIIAMWDFEADAADDNSFAAKGIKAGIKGYSYDLKGTANQGGMTYEYMIPAYAAGCPFLSGTAYPIVTTATWVDADARRTTFTKVSEDSRAAAVTEGESGAVTVGFADEGDHHITLTLENSYGSSERTFPVFEVISNPTAIDGIEADGQEMKTYTIDRTLFLEFAQAGSYQVYVYNTAGMMAGRATLKADAGQNAQIELGQPGIYLVKVLMDGRELRTIKVAAR